MCSLEGYTYSVHQEWSAEEFIPADSSRQALEIGLASGIRFLRSKDFEDKTPRSMVKCLEDGVNS